MSIKQSIRSLYCGDPHFKHVHKDEMDRLMGFVYDTAYKKDVDQVVILGDLNDSFGVLRTENLTFWNKWLTQLSSLKSKLYVLVGNHDKRNQGNDEDTENSLDVFNLIDSDRLFIIKSPVNFGLFGFIPYIHDKKVFVEKANLLKQQGAKVLVCHSEFDGGAYDNGFFIKDGIKPEDLDYDLVISGHIHTRSTIGKIRYPGTARWLTSSDANKEKGLWLVEHDSNTGLILKEEFLDTSHICAPIYSYQYKEGEEEPSIPDNSRASIELVGSSEWVSKQKVKFKGKASISVKITDKTKSNNRKTGNNLFYFIDKTFELSKGIEKEDFMKFMKDNDIL